MGSCKGTHLRISLNSIYTQILNTQYIIHLNLSALESKQNRNILDTQLGPTHLDSNTNYTWAAHLQFESGLGCVRI